MLHLQFEHVLREVFLRFSSLVEGSEVTTEPASGALLGPDDFIFANARTLNRQDLNTFARCTNGERKKIPSVQLC